jgi:glycosyltransferase involved in cell wall biosynthesis
LIEWGDGLFSPDRPLHLLGPLQEDIELPPWIHHHGPTNPAALREIWFPKVAGLLTLSQHDEGRPQVMIEAMAAGLPVIASRIAAHEDLIRHGQTGWLVADRAALADALVAAETPAEAQRIGRAAREFIAQRIGTWDDCAQRYVAAYRKLLEAGNAM